MYIDESKLFLNQKDKKEKLEKLEAWHEDLEKNNQSYCKWERRFYSLLKKSANLATLFATVTKKQINWDNVWLNNIIHGSTLGEYNENNIKFLFDNAIRSQVINKYDIVNNSIVVERNDGSVLKCRRLTDAIDGLAKDRPDLLTEKGSGHCHMNSYCLSYNLDMQHKLVSGFCSCVSESNKFPHTWIEFEGKKSAFVIDYNMNAIISKDGYYNLFNPTEVVAIEGKKVREDKKLIEKSSFIDRDIRYYLFKPDETMEIIRDELGIDMEECQSQM